MLTLPTDTISAHVNRIPPTDKPIVEIVTRGRLEYLLSREEHQSAGRQRRREYTEGSGEHSLS
jgi:hypothetical protein